jgi:hypothetical protein
MNKNLELIPDVSPPRPIRVETALSRYPVHRLSRKGTIDIDIREEDERGEIATRWEVDYSKKHGQPGPLAYKLDTLIVNRRIEEAARPIPKIIKLGSLRDICRELDLSEGENVNTIRKALRQNAFAGITAKTRYRMGDRTERTLEADFTRYSVVFTGEILPDGRKADAVYLILNDIYMQVINEAMARPLDYDYLKSLAPAPQRFYELLSYRMFAALSHERPRAKLTYSEFCTYAPQTRHFDWERVRSQMNKVHRSHRQSGYISAVESDQAVDKDGRPDWIMLYQPGPRAIAEYRSFASRGGPTPIEIETDPPAKEPTRDVTRRPPELETSLPVAALVERGVTPKTAAELIEQHSAETIQAKVDVFDWLMEKQDKRVAKSPAGYLVKSIADDYAPPKGFVSKAERQRQEEARQAKERQAADARRRQKEEEARECADKKAIAAYWESLTPEQQAELDVAADAAADPELMAMDDGPLKRIGQRLRRDGYIQRLLENRDEPIERKGIHARPC